jgi:hypothetical protein
VAVILLSVLFSFYLFLAQIGTRQKKNQFSGSEFWDVSLKFLKYFFTDIRPFKTKKNIKNLNLNFFKFFFKKMQYQHTELI